LEAKKIVVF